MSDTGPLVALFDVDGTLVRTDGLSRHSRAFREAFRRIYGSDCDFTAGMHGMTDLQIFGLIARDLALGDGRAEELARDACRVMVDIYSERHESDGSYLEIPGVRPVLEQLRARGVLLGLVTGNVPEIAMDKLETAGLAPFFSFGAFGIEGTDRALLPPLAVSRAEVVAGAPIPPRSVFVIGDTPRDVAAARASGYAAVAVATGHFTIDQLLETDADLVLPNLENPRPLLDLMGLPHTLEEAGLR